MNSSGPLKRLIFVLLVVYLLPALFYSGYELSSLSTSETLIGEIYSRQASAILFSINQYALDITNNWASSVNHIVVEHRHPNSDSLRSAIRISGKQARNTGDWVFR